MNRKFWRWVEKLASDKLAKDETHQNWPGIKNEFHALRGEIHTAWEHNGANMVQRINDITARQCSDQSVVLKDIIEDKHKGLKEFISRGESIAGGMMGRIFTNLHGVETKITDWFEQLNRGSEELSRQASVHDANNYERTTQLGEEIRRLRMKVDENQQLNYKTMLALYDSTMTAVLNLKSPDKQHFNSAPTLEWLTDNLDELIEVAELAKALRDNNMPRDTGIYKLVGAIRQLDLYSAMDVRDEIVSKLNTWDNGSSNVHRLHA